MRDRLRAAAELGLELIYPVRCVACGAAMNMKSYRGILSGHTYDGLCADCRAAVRYVDEPVCFKCGRHIENADREYCSDCAKAHHMYDRGAAVFHYDDMIKQSIYRFKYKGCRIYSRFYGDEMAKRCNTLIAQWKPEAIIPVPIHRAKMRKRGYNQAELIAERLSELTGIPMDKYLLERVINTRPQKELEGALRKKNVESAFKVNGNVVKYKKVILVDDIYTTGSTIDACAGALKQKGIQEVYYAAICIGAGI